MLLLWVLMSGHNLVLWSGPFYITVAECSKRIDSSGELLPDAPHIYRAQDKNHFNILIE